MTQPAYSEGLTFGLAGLCESAKSPQNQQMLNLRAPALALFNVALAAACASPKAHSRNEGAPITEEFFDDFERDSLGASYFATTDNYQLVNGALSAKGAFNHPLWLTRKLPRDVQIEFDCWSNSRDGDIKVEFLGDGKSHAPTKQKVQYTATGYVAVMGGWNNSKSLLARRDEHGVRGRDLSDRILPRVKVGKRYHWKITRQTDKVTWYVDDMSSPFLSFKDPQPLQGSGQAYFAFNNWQSDTWFDNLRISPL